MPHLFRNSWQVVESASDLAEDRIKAAARVVLKIYTRAGRTKARRDMYSNA